MARYTDEFRASAVVMLEAAGYPKTVGALARVSKELKCPQATLHRWFHAKQNPPPSEMVSIKKEQIIEALKQEAYSALMEMGKTRQDADYRELGTVMGIILDKLQLLTGEATERHEVIELDDDERSTLVAALFDKARARRTGQSATDD